MIGVVAAVLALFRDTIDFKIGPAADTPNAASISTANPAPSAGDNSDNYGWGPMREMYTRKEASPTAVFNSIVDNPVWGDERNYVRCRIMNDPNRDFVDEVAIRDDTELSVVVFIDDSSVRADQAIRGARMDLLIDPNPSINPALNVFLTGDNVIREWNGCKILSASPTTLSYIPGTAFLNIYGTPPIAVMDSVIRGDTLLPGVRGNAEGVIGGDPQIYGYIEFRVQAFVD
ncbi:hypothetical protein OG225_42260 (plasmid) [Nocardia sp. NBC_01377]|uniref:hypothetical protein n=1 Tax=Nocardia sp. NBC_01377 TaxID=2903595 RepID=UPI002F913388